MKNYSNNITGIMNCVKDCVKQAYDKGYKQGLAESEVEVKDADHIWYKKGQYISLKRFLEAKKESFNDGYNKGVLGVERKEQSELLDEIKVGDEVICAGTNTRKIVLKITDFKGVLRYMCFSDESGYSTENENFPPKKTGRHFDIDKILEQMKEVDK